MLSGAPLVSTWTPSGPLTSTLTLRRSKSNGSSARFTYAAMAGCSCARRAASSGLRTPVSRALLMHAHRSTSSEGAPRTSTADCMVRAPSGQRASLVTAQHIHGAEVLDSRQMFDDHLAVRHALSAGGQRHGTRRHMQEGELMGTVRVETPREIGARVAAARRGRGLSQKDLSLALGIPVYSVDRIEAGAVDAQDHLSSIATVTGREIEWFTSTSAPQPRAPHSTNNTSRAAPGMRGWPPARLDRSCSS